MTGLASQKALFFPVSLIAIEISDRPQRFRNLVLESAPLMQLRYAIMFFLRKMTSHRWNSVPKRCFQHTPIGNAQRCFPEPHFEPRLNCISDFRPPAAV